MDFAIAISDFETSEDVQGTGFWRAPEVLQCLEEQVTVSGIQWEAADVYSFGMTCYKILTGRTPFHDRPWSDYKVVLSGGRPELPGDIPEGLKDMIQRCWHHDPKARPSFAEIVPLLKQIGGYNEIWEAGFKKEQSLMHWESSLGTPDPIFLKLVRQIVTQEIVHTSGRHSQRVMWASKFVCTAKGFVSKFGWVSYVRNPSLPFNEYIERDMLCNLMSAEYFERRVIVDGQGDRTIRLMAKILFTAVHGFERIRYSEQDHDEELTLSDKISIIQKAFVKPLVDAGVRKFYIFLKTQRLVHQASSNELQGDVGKLQLRYFMTVLLLLIWEYVRRLGRLPNILESRFGVDVDVYSQDLHRFSPMYQ